jgi:hypothetical protein
VTLLTLNKYKVVNVVLIKNVILMRWVNGIVKIVLVGMLTGLELDPLAMKIGIHVQKAILRARIGDNHIACLAGRRRTRTRTALGLSCLF